MTHPAWLPALYQPVTPAPVAAEPQDPTRGTVDDPSALEHPPEPLPELDASLVLDEQPTLKRIDSLFLRSNPLAADLLVRTLNLNPAGGGPVAHYAQFFRNVPVANWDDQFDALIDPVVDLLGDRLAEPTARGDLLAWGAGLALRFQNGRLLSAPLFLNDGAPVDDPLKIPTAAYSDQGTHAWLYLSQASLEQVVCSLWARATSAEPPSPSSTPGKGRRSARVVAPTLLGGKDNAMERIVEASRSTLGDDLRADIAWEEDNLHLVRNQIRAGQRAAAATPRIAHVIDMAYHVAKTRRESWETAKELEREDEPLTVDPMVQALHEGLFGGGARDPDDYDDDDDVALNDEEDGYPDDDEEDAHQVNVNPEDAAQAQRLLALLQNNPGLSAADLMEHLGPDVDPEEPVPQARALRRRRPVEDKPRLPETMPNAWGMESWPKEAQRFQWAFERSLQTATRGLRGLYVERFVDWIEQNDGGPTWKLGQRVWGQRLTQSEFNRLTPARPMAERLLGESPRLALFALRVAPLLGIETIELDLLGQVKKALRERGVTDAAWKKTVPGLSASWMLDAWGDQLRMAETPVADCALNLLAWKDKGNLLPADLTRAEGLLADPESPAVESLLAALNPAPVAPYEPDADADADEDDEETFDDEDDDHEDERVYRTPRETASKEEPLDPEAQALRQAVLEQAREVEHQARLARLPSLAKAIIGRLNETSVANFFTNEWPLVNDFLRRSELGTWQTFPDRMTWPMLWRRQQHWHDALLQAQKGKHYRYTWDSVLGPFTDGTYVALPLTNGGDLWEEGKVMHHCVSDYASDCKRGTHRIFSIRKGDQRLGTLELVHTRNGAWSMGQFKGFCNQGVKDAGARAFVKLVRAAYIQAEVQRTLPPVAPDASSLAVLPSPSAPASTTPVSPEDEAHEWLELFKANLPARPMIPDDEDPPPEAPRRPRP